MAEVIGDAVYRILVNFEIKLKKDVKNNYKKKQKEKAAKKGTPYNEKEQDSIRGLIKEKSGGYKFELVMADYLYWVDKSRGTGGVSKKGQESIQAWIKTKGINAKKIIESFADKKKTSIAKVTKTEGKKLTFEIASKQLTFLIAQSIKKHGYAGTGFFTEIMNDGRLVKLKEDLQKELNKEIEIVLTQIK